MIPEQLSHYRIIRQIGAGGMGEVYLAEDQQLGRQVALKLLPPKFTQDKERLRRFEQEAHAASRLSHPHIMTIYEVGAVEGLHFIVTEYIKGRTLKARLAEGRLRVEEALELIAQVASALDALHQAGIVHRDIKPENLMQHEDGYLKLLDFGLAKLSEPLWFTRAVPQDMAVTQAEEAEAPFADPFATQFDASQKAKREGLAETTPGLILGTLRYMSPEQARGQKVDARSDLFSLGIVFYEMLTGRPPFDGPTTGDVMVALLDRQPQPLKRYAPEINAEVEAWLAKALAKERHERYQTAAELLTELKCVQRSWRRATSGAGDSPTGRVALETEPLEETPVDSSGGRKAGRSGSAPAGDSSGASGRASGRRGARAFDSLAVLPFVNASASSSGSDDAGYLSEGIPESLIRNLARLPQLRVMAWSTMARYRGQEHDPLTVGRELGVSAVFAGRLHQFSERLVIKAELVSTADGSQIWGGQYQRALADVFALEQEIAQELCQNLRLRLNEAEQAQVARRYTENPAAYRAFLQGRYYWQQRSAAGLRQAIAAFQQAIALDPTYAPAHVGLADCFMILGAYGAMPPRMVMPQAKQLILRALQLDHTLAEAHASLGALHAWFDWDWPASEREFKRAMELNPTYAMAPHWYASIYLAAQGRLDEALEYQQRAAQLEPLSLVINTNLGWITYQARAYEQAATHCQRALELQPAHVQALYYLALVHIQQERFDEAISLLQKSWEISGEGTVLRGGLGYAYARAGQRAEAEAVLAELTALLPTQQGSHYFLAMVQAGLGHTEAALQALELAFEERVCMLVHLPTEPIFDSLRHAARFTELIRRVGLSA
ncbi:MAG: protein kinase [Acidobacteria bacterium]|nr:protein kinase [Acidobacteriota bacterium]MBI3421980.1 protein kinase [Acidobacteriota bacterium]